ncbi:DEKNAAC102849 [Brettanomyces naardenensis]|uniref:DEKNAAC102849 n=1 Tax=Brettanomyces naardenensis TaxID=13370 RepID=A0A448YLQ4_BRENA|nr:DEKNAAC102849 [Brettanomyces naardenensis]
MNSKENTPPYKDFKFEIKMPNRRHTLVPSHSILKPTTEDNNTIAVIPSNKGEKRRVSFAPEVTLHKITTHYSHYPAKPSRSEKAVSRRSSLPSLHSYSKDRTAGRSILKLTVAEAGDADLSETSSDEDYSQRVNKVKVGPIDSSVMGSHIDEDNSTQTMEFSTDLTDQIRGQQNEILKQNSNGGADSDQKELSATDVFQEAVRDLQEDDQTHTMDLTQLEGTRGTSELDSDAEHTMEFTQLVNKKPDSVIVADNDTATMDFSRRTSLGEISEIDETKTMELTGPVVRSESPNKRHLDLTGTEYDEGHEAKRMKVVKEVVSDAVESVANSSYSEQLDTEMIPLAEVSTEIEDDGGSQVTTDLYEEEDDDDDDDGYENVTLSSFLDEVNVQFFDSIDPSERELSADVDDSHKASLVEYVKAVNSIPDFRYFEHLIKQYRNSIHSIRGIVLDFEKNVKENNPTSIKEYYEQTDELRRDLKINYQALASFAREQAKKENLSYLINLLEQLKKSYQDSGRLLDVQMEKVIEIRKRILLRQQTLIEQKSELQAEITKLQHQQASVSDESREALKKLKVKISAEITKKNEIESQIHGLKQKAEGEAPTLDAQAATNKQLKDENSALRDQLQTLKVPTEDELAALRAKFTELEMGSQVRLVYLTDELLKVSVMNDVEVSVDLSTGDRSLDIVYRNRELTGLLSELKKYLECLNIVPLKGYIAEVRNTWAKFKSLVKDLMMMKLRYESVSNGEPDKDSLVLYSSGHYKLTISYKKDDLLRFGEPIKVDADLVVLGDGEANPSSVLANAISKSRLKIPTLKRFVVNN